jgi:hypothetical protein
MGRRSRRREQLLGEIKEKRKFRKLSVEALYRTLWRVLKEVIYLSWDRLRDDNNGDDDNHGGGDGVVKTISISIPILKRTNMQ